MPRGIKRGGPYRGNPWGLTRCQHDALKAMIEHGSAKGAVRAIGVSVKTLEAHIGQARERMKADFGRVNVLIVFDRWERQQPPVSAASTTQEVPNP